jgi:hypothetical protein
MAMSGALGGGGRSARFPARAFFKAPVGDKIKGGCNVEVY